jgi:two-component system sensor kinase FixL
MRTSPRRSLAIRVAPGRDNLIVVSISDTGSGIGELTFPRLFEPFTTTKKDGMGVGLSICRTIIEAHGGTIAAENNLTGGATFTFTLPNVNEAAPSV